MITPPADDWRGSGAPEIELCPNGPLLVRGDIGLVDSHGNPVARHRRTLALCRCGASAVKPFCDGTHKLNGFRTDDPPPN